MQELWEVNGAMTSISEPPQRADPGLVEELMQSPQVMVDELLRAARHEPSPELVAVDARVGVADVLHEISAFDAQQHILEDLDLPAICLDIPHQLPRPVLIGDGSVDAIRRSEEIYDQLRERQSAMVLPVREAQRVFEQRLAGFMEVRSATALHDEAEAASAGVEPATEPSSTDTESSAGGFRGWMSSATSRMNSVFGTSPAQQQTFLGTPFEVRCGIQGLHVYYSMAFVLRVNRQRQVFGSRLTSPVVQTLRPGIWAFATSSPGGSEHWEDAEVTVPDSDAVDLAGVP